MAARSSGRESQPPALRSAVSGEKLSSKELYIWCAKRRTVSCGLYFLTLQMFCLFFFLKNDKAVCPRDQESFWCSDEGTQACVGEFQKFPWVPPDLTGVIDNWHFCPQGTLMDPKHFVSHTFWIIWSEKGAVELTRSRTVQQRQVTELDFLTPWHCGEGKDVKRWNSHPQWP